MFDWLGDIISGIGSAIGDTIEFLGTELANSIFDSILQWMYEIIYGAVADFFTMMGNMGADIFDLSWIKETIRLFSLFGWTLFIAGLVVAIFDVAIEYQCGRANIRTTSINILKGFLPVRLLVLCRWNCTSSASVCKTPSPVTLSVYWPEDRHWIWLAKARRYWKGVLRSPQM